VKRPYLPPIRARLAPDELRLVHQLDALSCVRTEPVGYGERFFELGWGPTAPGDGARVAASSAMGVVLDDLVGAARLRAAEARLATVPFILHLAALPPGDDGEWRRSAATYDLSIDAGGTLVVRRGDRELLRQPVDPIELVEVMDFIRAGAVDDVDRLIFARGSAVIDGERYPIALATYDRGLARHVHDWLWTATRAP
jgi:hypothetical protein